MEKKSVILRVWDLDTNKLIHSDYYKTFDEAHDWYDMHWSDLETNFDIEEL